MRKGNRKKAIKALGKSCSSSKKTRFGFLKRSMAYWKKDLDSLFIFSKDGLPSICDD
ncbi:hypothetical protein GCM10022410_24940 [Amphibacillus indicireducens]|uniref:Uncharacterized protein n=1 Tax=Amphibacillus indicireducens TaxID=1076330 RepID=A0ABP7W3F0_9BACI